MLSESLDVAATLLLHELQFSLNVYNAVKNLPDSAGDMSSIPGLERPLEKGMATHSSILAWKNPMDRGVWWATVHEVAKDWIQLSY